MANKKDLKVGDKVKHRWRNWYQNCEVIEIEEGCNGGIKVLCQDSPIYGFPTIDSTFVCILGFGESISRFCPQDITKIT